MNFLVIFIATFSSLAFAQQDATSTFPTPQEVSSFEEQKFHVGVRVGMVNPEESYDGAFEYGAEVGFQPYIPFSVGMELTNFSSDNDQAADLERLKLLLKGAYNFGGNTHVIRNSFVGAGLGPVLDTIGETTRGRLGINLLAGFDIPLTDTGSVKPNSVSLGATANYLFVSNSAPDTFGVTGLVKYWF